MPIVLVRIYRVAKILTHDAFAYIPGQEDGKEETEPRKSPAVIRRGGNPESGKWNRQMIG